MLRWKKIIVITVALTNKNSFAAACVAAGSGVGVGAVAAIAGLSPAVWIAATFGSIYVYLHHAEKPRNRIFNIAISIILGVGGGDAAAGYLRVSQSIESWFLAPICALLIAMFWPWFFEKFLGAKGDK